MQTRKAPGIGCPQKPLIEDHKHYPNLITESFTIDVITPLFGGGTKDGKNDSVTPVRVPEIRGMLRFWWRATKGMSFTNIEELNRREGEIWGRTDNPSQIEISIEYLALGQRYPCAEYQKVNGKYKVSPIWKLPFDGRNSPFPYILFPFKGEVSKDKERIVKQPAEFIEGLKIRIILRSSNRFRMSILRHEFNEERKKSNLKLLTESDDDISNDIQAALWAWTNFGGIGARTRRGFGALYCSELAISSANDFAESVKNFINEHKINWGQEFKPWPCLPRVVFVSNKACYSPEEAWYSLAKLLNDFRQGRGTGRDQKGVTMWPEAQSIRKLAGRNIKPSDVPTEYFPRAEFGMPIILELKDENLKPTLQYSEKIDRMASPIILRPIRFGDNTFGAMLALLHVEPIKEAYLKEVDGLNHSVRLQENQIRNVELVKYADSPMRPRKSKVNHGLPQYSALRSFLEYAKDNGFEEIAL